MTDHTPSGQQAVDIEAALRWADRHEARERQKLRDMGLPPEGDMPVTGAFFVRGLVAMLRTAAPTAPSTAAGELAFVCGCGWDGSYADLNETVEGMTCPKCRLGRNLDCAAAPPAQSPPWQEQAARWHEEQAGHATVLALAEPSLSGASHFLQAEVAHHQHARDLRALLSKPAKGEGN